MTTPRHSVLPFVEKQSRHLAVGETMPQMRRVPSEKFMCGRKQRIEAVRSGDGHHIKRDCHQVGSFDL